MIVRPDAAPLPLRTRSRSRVLVRSGACARGWSGASTRQAGRLGVLLPVVRDDGRGRELRALGAGRPLCRRTTSRRSTTRRSACTRPTIPAVLDDQMAEIQRAGIDEIAVSWWGKGSPEDQRLPAVIAGGDGARHRRRGPHRAVQRPDASRASAPTSPTSRPSGSGRSTSTRRSRCRLSGWAPLNDALRAQGVTIYAADGARRAGRGGPLQRASTPTTSSRGPPRSSHGSAARRTRTACSCAPSVGPGYDARRATGDPHLQAASRRPDLRLDVARSDPRPAPTRSRSRPSTSGRRERRSSRPPRRRAAAASSYVLLQRCLGPRRARCRSGLPRPHRLLGGALPAGAPLAAVPRPDVEPISWARDRRADRLRAARAAAERAHGRAARRDPGLRGADPRARSTATAGRRRSCSRSAAITDQIDGFLARRWHVESRVREDRRPARRPAADRRRRRAALARGPASVGRVPDPRARRAADRR